MILSHFGLAVTTLNLSMRKDTKSKVIISINGNLRRIFCVFYSNGPLHDERSLETVTNLNASRGMFQFLCSARILLVLPFSGTSVSLGERNKLPKRPALNYIMKIHILLMINNFEWKMFQRQSLRRHWICEWMFEPWNGRGNIIGGWQWSIRSAPYAKCEVLQSSQTSFFSPTMIVSTCLFA